MGRSPCCDKTKIKKGPWSLEEDQVLKNFVSNFGNGGNWISLPKTIGLNRCGKSCRLRWLNYLRPDIKHGDFTEEEDLIIYTLYNIVGSRWSIIASKLPRRTDNDVKNYWNTKLKKKILAGKIKNNFINNGINNSQGDEYYSESYASTNSMTQVEVSSQYKGTSNNIIMSNNEEENEFWMDLFSESFDDVRVNSQLIEDKITEIASLLDVFIV
ncbi:hypothetical protein RND81_08G045200 [Saponaria officinalis]|uniref:Uncharacterized protein n=1 Tax=Saponaria officinalis TaxID=3572 RepID=A0AAW1J3R5_SAPOF